ncbi:helix-turn-helix domain-containing protein [Actinophytocola sediminis]
MARQFTADVEARVFVAALGDELLRSRKKQGLSRREFISRAGVDIAESTLMAYESGTRRMGVHRLWTLCRELPVDPGELVGAAHRRVVGPVEAVHIDLAKLARTKTERLRPLRSWAAARSREAQAVGPTDFPFGAAALGSMANHCGISQAEFIAILVDNEAVHL